MFVTLFAYTPATGYLSFYNSNRYGLQESCNHPYTPATLKIREGEKMIRGGGKFFYIHDLAEQIVCRKKS